MKNIVLCGFMGSGKTTIGKKLATALNMRFVDTDSLLEKQENMSIPEIFAQQGEAYFRKKEADLCDSLNELTNTVIATGGGFSVNELVAPKINGIGTVVYL
ncbi:MAG: shikimate kinase, partial [Clostridia bacterium]|nr:shikimate kinase [Clostridia bacterium]